MSLMTPLGTGYLQWEELMEEFGVLNPEERDAGFRTDSKLSEERAVAVNFLRQGI